MKIRSGRGKPKKTMASTLVEEGQGWAHRNGFTRSKGVKTNNATSGGEGGRHKGRHYKTVWGGRNTKSKGKFRQQ